MKKLLLMTLALATTAQAYEGSTRFRFVGNEYYESFPKQKMEESGMTLGGGVSYLQIYCEERGNPKTKKNDFTCLLLGQIVSDRVSAKDDPFSEDKEPRILIDTRARIWGKLARELYAAKWKQDEDEKEKWTFGNKKYGVQITCEPFQVGEGEAPLKGCEVWVAGDKE